MISLNPCDRPKASELIKLQYVLYLIKLINVIQSVDKAFPSSFISFVHPYVKSLFDRAEPNINYDKIIMKISEDSESVLSNSSLSNQILIFISIVSAVIGTLSEHGSKLIALDLLISFSRLLHSSIALERILPILVLHLKDRNPHVRALSVHYIANIIPLLDGPPDRPENLYLYPEYILPSLVGIATDEVDFVRCELAKSIGLISRKALNNLEIAQVNLITTQIS